MNGKDEGREADSNHLFQDIGSSPMLHAGDSDEENDETRYVHGLAWFFNSRNAVFRTLEEPSSSWYASVYAMFICVFIIVSIVALLIESLPELYGRYTLVFFFVDSMVAFVFTVDYVARLSTCTEPYFWVFRFLNVIDFISVMPFYADIIFDILGFSFQNSAAFTVFRAVRLVRVVRVFKVSRYTQGLNMIISSLNKSASTLFSITVLLAIVVIMFSSIEYYLERGTWDSDNREWIRENGTVSPFSSIPASFWWCFVTITTVGYGDAVPITILGKCVAVGAMIVGVVGISFPITIIGTNFAEEWNAFRRQKRQEEHMHRMVKLLGRDADYKEAEAAMIHDLTDAERPFSSEVILSPDEAAAGDDGSSRHGSQYLNPVPNSNRKPSLPLSTSTLSEHDRHQPQADYLPAQSAPSLFAQGDVTSDDDDDDTISDGDVVVDNSLVLAPPNPAKAISVNSGKSNAKPTMQRWKSTSQVVVRNLHSDSQKSIDMLDNALIKVRVSHDGEEAQMFCMPNSSVGAFLREVGLVFSKELTDVLSLANGEGIIFSRDLKMRQIPVGLIFLIDREEDQGMISWKKPTLLSRALSSQTNSAATIKTVM
jgi:hypothetical protein